MIVVFYLYDVEEFSAHNANVTCLALGQKSGLVLATGGADNKVNLWKVDSETCFMVIFLLPKYFIFYYLEYIFNYLFLEFMWSCDSY